MKLTARKLFLKNKLANTHTVWRHRRTMMGNRKGLNGHIFVLSLFIVTILGGEILTSVEPSGKRKLLPSHKSLYKK